MSVDENEMRKCKVYRYLVSANTVVEIVAKIISAL